MAETIGRGDCIGIITQVGLGQLERGSHWTVILEQVDDPDIRVIVCVLVVHSSDDWIVPDPPARGPESALHGSFLCVREILQQQKQVKKFT